MEIENEKYREVIELTSTISTHTDFEGMNWYLEDFESLHELPIILFYIRDKHQFLVLNWKWKSVVHYYVDDLLEDKNNYAIRGICSDKGYEFCNEFLYDSDGEVMDDVNNLKAMYRFVLQLRKEYKI